MQINQTVEQPVAMMCSDHQGGRGSMQELPQASPGRCQQTPSSLIAPPFAPQIGPDCWPGLGTYPGTNFVHQVSSKQTKS